MNVLIVNASGHPFKPGIAGRGVRFDDRGCLSSGNLRVKYVAPGAMIAGERFDLVIVDLPGNLRNERFRVWLEGVIMCRLDINGVLIDL